MTDGKNSHDVGCNLYARSLRSHESPNQSITKPVTGICFRNLGICTEQTNRSAFFCCATSESHSCSGSESPLLLNAYLSLLD